MAAAPRGSHNCSTCAKCLHDGAKCCGCYDGACCRNPENPYGDLMEVASYVASLIYGDAYSQGAQHQAVHRAQREVAVRVAESICARLDGYDGKVEGWYLDSLVLALSGSTEAERMTDRSEHSDDCVHDWTLRPESDTYVCEICGVER